MTAGHDLAARRRALPLSRAARPVFPKVWRDDRPLPAPLIHDARPPPSTRVGGRRHGAGARAVGGRECARGVCGCGRVRQ
eukprot:6395665-Prymnesium_polylepis.1